MVNQPQFDVFLAHNSLDKPQVRVIANYLKQRGLQVWLDEDQMYPGDTPYREIQNALYKSKSVVFFIGSSGSGRWQGTLELPITVDLVINSNLRLIPVLLPGIEEVPREENYSFLRTKLWIKFETINDTKALEQLCKGINRVGNGEPTQQKPEASKIQQPNTDDLSSEKGVNYKRLRALLAARKWKEADEETLAVMLRASGTEGEGRLDVTSIIFFPCTDLRTIDQLWVKYSNGRFGFSVQKPIWESVAGNLDANYETYQKFGDRVGWRVKETWIDYPDDVIFSISATIGHLPIVILGGLFFDFDPRQECGLLSFLFSRVETCNVLKAKTSLPENAISDLGFWE